jgi:hypothetical protein
MYALAPSLNARVRGDVLRDSSWLGADLRILLFFAVFYTLARLIPRNTHRVSCSCSRSQRRT